MSKKLIGNKKKGSLFVISAPAGTGKSTLVEMLLKEFPNEIAKSCSYTTRSKRPNEIADKHYHFVSADEFEEKIGKDEFLEYAKVFGNYYGTQKQEVARLREQGKHIILVIDTQGAMKIRDQADAIFIFISPPSLEELRNRLFKRRTESEEKMNERLEWAKREIEMAPRYDYHLVNDELEVTYQVLRSIFIAEEYRR
ncbi:MAG: guanylate kinase [Chlamydiales bacterium]